ncbi:MAG: ParB/RepB/Spo0J family partition protein [Chloroflexi bacterium]|nr:ParB/RepB/Spo0J family partition protein [Chloroflexota bacterium]
MPQQHRGLGRGLGALIPRGQGGMAEVDVGRIQPNPDQPRLALDAAALGELADSIRQHGVLQPLIVAQAEEGYVLVAGERRWRAAQLAGLRTVPVLVREATSRQRLELALVENLQREDLSPLEQATAYRHLLDEHALSQEALAERVGKSRVAISNTLRLLALPLEAREALAQGRISEGHARALLGCPDHARLLHALSAVLEQGLSVRQAEELVRRLAEPPEPNDHSEAPPRQRPVRDVQALAIEEQLQHALGTRVQLFRSRRGGKLVIYFYDDEQLDGLCQAMGIDT